MPADGSRFRPQAPEPAPEPDGPISPFNALPPLVVALALAIVGVEALFWAGERGYVGGPDALGWRLAAISNHAFLIPVFDWMIENRVFPAEHVARFVTYPLIHAGFAHALFSTIFVLAIGKLVAETFGQPAFALLFLAGTVCGALAYGLVLSDPHPLIGAYPGVFALLGAYSFLLWHDPNRVGPARWGAFVLVGALIGIQLVFRLLFGGSNDWVADLGGAAAGFLLSYLLAPGGWRGLMARLRRR